MLAKVANKDTRSVVSALIKQARKLPSELYKSLTWDRGKELSDHRRFTLTTNIDVYFCADRSYEIPQDADLRNLARVVSACTLRPSAFGAGRETENRRDTSIRSGLGIKRRNWNAQDHWSRSVCSHGVHSVTGIRSTK